MMGCVVGWGGGCHLTHVLTRALTCIELRTAARHAGSDSDGLVSLDLFIYTSLFKVISCCES